MEKAVSDWLSYLRVNDQDPVDPKKTDLKNRRSKEQWALNVKERPITKIASISAKKTTFNWVIKNDSSLRRKSPTKTSSNHCNERRNYQLRINHVRVQHWAWKTTKGTSELQEEIFYSEKKRTATKIREKDTVRFH